MIYLLVHNSSFMTLKYDINSKTFKEGDDAILWDKLPFKTILFVDDNSFIAGGYDCDPVKFKITNGEKG